MPRRLALCALAVVFGVWVCRAESATGPKRAVWVFFQPIGDRAAHPKRAISERAYERRARRGSVALNADDLPVYQPYLERLSRHVERIRTVSRWFNAASVEATPSQEAEIARWPEVRAVLPVSTGRRALEPEGVPVPRARIGRPDAALPEPAAYGESFWQDDRIGVPPLHGRGLSGAGVLVCVIDAGFARLDHAAFAHLNVVAAWDFVAGSPVLVPDSHGAQVLSVLAGEEIGALVGPAYGAEVALARTEIREQEVRVEEDYWIAAVEWADSLGADVITSSVGYNTFDDATTNHTLAELDGSSLLTRAADRAVERGIVVVIAGGNERGPFADLAWQGRITMPADGFHVLAVGATTPDDSLASFSSVGPTADGRIKPDVVAPGTGVVAVDGMTATGYTRVSGTSHACPLVAGAAALLLQAHPEWTPSEVAHALAWTAKDLGAVGPDNEFGWGLINVASAVDAVTSSGLVGLVTTTLTRPLMAPLIMPVARARVEIAGPASAVTASDVRGLFGYHPLPPGPYTITCRTPGYATATFQSNVPQQEPIRIELAAKEDAGERYRLTPNPATRGSGVTLAGAVHPELEIAFYDVAGNLVRKLAPGESHWDLTAESGHPVAAGVYICRAEVSRVEVWRGKLAVVR